MSTLLSRLEKVEALHKANTKVPLYVFSTVMRSPWAGGKGVEPDYYLTMGSDIYQLASLQAKMDEEGLNPPGTERLVLPSCAAFLWNICRIGTIGAARI